MNTAIDKYVKLFGKTQEELIADGWSINGLAIHKGDGSYATGKGAKALGEDARACGDYALAIGDNTAAIGKRARHVIEGGE